jgi:hypothetical protein
VQRRRWSGDLDFEEGRETLPEKGQDLAHIRAFYADKTGLHPALAGKIRLRDDI